MIRKPRFANPFGQTSLWQEIQEETSRIGDRALCYLVGSQLHSLDVYESILARELAIFTLAASAPASAPANAPGSPGFRRLWAPPFLSSGPRPSGTGKISFVIVSCTEALTLNMWFAKHNFVCAYPDCLNIRWCRGEAAEPPRKKVGVYVQRKVSPKHSQRPNYESAVRSVLEEVGLLGCRRATSPSKTTVVPRAEEDLCARKLYSPAKLKPINLTPSTGVNTKNTCRHFGCSFYRLTDSVLSASSWKRRPRSVNSDEIVLDLQTLLQDIKRDQKEQSEKIERNHREQGEKIQTLQNTVETNHKQQTRDLSQFKKDVMERLDVVDVAIDDLTTDQETMADKLFRHHNKTNADLRRLDAIFLELLRIAHSLGAGGVQPCAGHWLR